MPLKFLFGSNTSPIEVKIRVRGIQIFDRCPGMSHN